MTGDEVRKAEFRERWRGYEPGDVDEVLERLAAAIDRGDRLDPDELGRVEPRQRFRGYDPAQVDALLAQLRRENT